MRRLLSLITGMAMGAGLMWAALQYHVLRTNNGFTYVPKRQATLTDTYIDVRNWTALDWTKHPDLIWTLHQNNKDKVVQDPRVLEATLKDAINRR